MIYSRTGIFILSKNAGDKSFSNIISVIGILVVTANDSFKRKENFISTHATTFKKIL